MTVLYWIFVIMLMAYWAALIYCVAKGISYDDLKYRFTKVFRKREEKHVTWIDAD